MKCQILSSGKKEEKYFNMSSDENFTQSAKPLSSILLLPFIFGKINLKTKCRKSNKGMV